MNKHNIVNIKTMQVFYYKFTRNPESLVFVANLTECQGGLLGTDRINISQADMGANTLKCI